jgi:hypothetical protein
MSDESMFSKHLRLIEADEKTWTPEEREEFERLKEVDLPPLTLPPRPMSLPASLFHRASEVLRQTLGAAPLSPSSFAGALTVAGLAIFVSVLVFKDEWRQSDRLSPKGAVQVSVFWERAGKVSPLLMDSNLVDGDKVGATVLSAEDAVAYWAITDKDFKVLSDQADVEASKISLQAGVRKSFGSSFELVPPNQGENLVIVICPKSRAEPPKNDDTALLFDQAFVAKLTSEARIRSSDCVFVGSRLRRMP